MKTRISWLSALLLVSAAASAGEIPTQEKPEADAKAKAEEDALQNRVAEVLKVFASGDEKAIKELQESLCGEGAVAAKVLDLATQKEVGENSMEHIIATQKALYRKNPALAVKIRIVKPTKPITVIPYSAGPIVMNRKDFKYYFDLESVEIKNNGYDPLVIARPKGGSEDCQEYPYYDLQFLTQDGENIDEPSRIEDFKSEPFRASDFIRLEHGEYWGKLVWHDWPRPKKSGKYQMRLRYVMPNVEHKTVNEEAARFAKEASIGEVFSNTVEIEFVFPSDEEIKRLKEAE